ncbi:hypothetical protein HYS82_02125, partial [Candidatus Amesbacteria bacterium]|nr:hypothetical protein [Candidatus Amesbacteria bacterium]
GGVGGEGEWGQVHNFGDLVTVISFAGGAEAGREALTRIRELQHDGGLEKAVRTVEEEFGAEVGCVMAQGGKVYVAGNIRIWTKRGDGRQGWLNDSRVMVSNIDDGLTLVLGNGKFWGCVPEGMVRAMTEAEELGAVVHGGVRGNGSCGAIIKFQIPNLKSQISPNTQIPITKYEGKEGWWKRVRWPRIRNYESRITKRVNPVWIGVGFLILAVLVFGGGAMWKKEIERRRSGIDEKIETMRQKFDEAKGLAGLNPVRSRELLLEIETELQSDIVTKKKDPRILGIESEMGMVKEEAMGVRRPVAEEVIDLGLVRDGMTGGKMAIGEGELWVVGSEGRVVGVSLKQKSGKVTEQVDGGRLIAYYPGKTYVLGNEGIGQVPIDEEWNDIKDMEVWAGNIYLLDTDQIWVYRTAEKKEAWLDEKQELGNSMTIDGNVWVLTGNQILKFTRGVKQEFGVSGIENFKGEVIYTDDNAENLYILDKERGKVVAVKKTGEYEGQYLLDQAKEATDLIVDEQNKKLYLLGGSKIWEVGL